MNASIHCGSRIADPDGPVHDTARSDGNRDVQQVGVERPRGTGACRDLTARALTISGREEKSVVPFGAESMSRRPRSSVTTTRAPVSAP